MWKRLWWSLRVSLLSQPHVPWQQLIGQIRDVLISASLGRPQHVWQGDCDVEQPEADDVAEQFIDSIPAASNYFIQLAKLSTISTLVL
jgi:hypothetical protein